MSAPVAVRLHAGPEGDTTWCQPVLRCSRCSWLKYLRNGLTLSQAKAISDRHAATHAKPRPVPAPARGLAAILPWRSM